MCTLRITRRQPRLAVNDRHVSLAEIWGGIFQLRSRQESRYPLFLILDLPSATYPPSVKPLTLKANLLRLFGSFTSLIRRNHIVMQIIIVGAGIAGLSLAIALSQAKHSIIIVESAAQLAELGAGIQMTPQAVKYFYQWGLKEDILAQCITVQKTFIRDHRDGSAIGVLNVADMERQYDAPYIVVHRAALHDILHKHAIRSGAEIMLDSKVTEYDFENGAILLRNGKRMEADLVIAADGIYPDQEYSSNANSCRHQLLRPLSAPSNCRPRPSTNRLGRIQDDGRGLQNQRAP